MSARRPRALARGNSEGVVAGARRSLLLACMAATVGVASVACASVSAAQGSAAAAPIGPATAVVAGDYHTCALMSGGVMKCWGNNGSGDLGDGVMTESPTPVPVSGLTGPVSSMTAGLDYTCALSGGTVSCWGTNGFGQLGNGTTVNSFTPVPVTGLAGVTEVSAGFDHACAVTGAGAVECWGRNNDGELGNGTTAASPAPVPVTGLSSGVTAVAAGTRDTCALTAAGGVECWGWGFFGQLGTGSRNGSKTPVPVLGLSSGVTAITAGAHHNCALMRSGTVKCWGYNFTGELGLGAKGDHSKPVTVRGLPGGITAIAAGLYDECARTRRGTVSCWGFNGSGELGDGTTVNRYLPVTVKGLDNVAAVAAGGYHTCALVAGGTVHCWGHNAFGELGDGTTNDRLTAVGQASCRKGAKGRCAKRH
jgi:alpha-tubulin suppressor-like RCC1 family protein